jgi:hypothetical protein
MRGSPAILISILCAVLLVQATAGMTISVSQMPVLYVSDYGEGIAHPINSYTIKPTAAVSGGAWMVLATNDQATFARIDSRNDIDFSAGELKQFNVANSASYRCTISICRMVSPSGWRWCCSSFGRRLGGGLAEGVLHLINALELSGISRMST